MASKAYMTGEYNLFCKGQKYIKNRSSYDKTFGTRSLGNKCASCGIGGADRYHYRNGNYYCTRCAKSNRMVIEERHVP